MTMAIDSSCKPYRWPADQPRSPHFTITAGDKTIDVLECESGSFALFEISAKVELTVELPTDQPGVVIRPLRHALTPPIQNGRFVIPLDGPVSLVCEFPGLPDLFIFAVAPDPAVPDRNDPDVIFFEAGKTHECEMITPASNQTVYIEGGAVVRTSIQVRDAENVRIAGRGILQGPASIEEGQGTGRQRRRVWLRRGIAAYNCRHFVVEGIA
ncbi:MAG: hypothetical protein GF331_22965, partial [Chitinivibrionales bacterium]|nr:hypothetical protein [Chitinivibrionales bacterium]